MRLIQFLFQEGSGYDVHKPIVLSLTKFTLTHCVIPAIVLLISFIWLERSGADLWLSSHFYDQGKHLWPYKDHWLIQKVLHKGGRLFYFTIIGGVAILIAASLKTDGALKQYQRSLVYLLLASISGPLIVMFLKNHTHILLSLGFANFRQF